MCLAEVEAPDSGRDSMRGVMTTERRLRLVVVALTMLAACASAPSAQMFVTTGRDTLRSLPGVEVVVDPVQSELERAGSRQPV
jgi:uncharacterized lipoprotein YmbA